MAIRNNGLERPYNSSQIFTWFLLPFMMTAFYGVITPILPVAASICATILFTAACCASFYFGYLTCTVNPVDPHLAAHLLQKGKGRSKGGDDKIFCWVCQAHVRKESKHCRFCEKCVDRFDHHCLWLNTCVGRKNYPYFLRTVASTLVFNIIFLVCAIYVTISYFTDSGSIKSNVASLYGIHTPAYIILECIGGGVALANVFMIGQLGWFHFQLVRKDMTTYEFIVLDQKKTREADKVRAARKANGEKEGILPMYCGICVDESVSGGKGSSMQMVVKTTGGGEANENSEKRRRKKAKASSIVDEMDDGFHDLESVHEAALGAQEMLSKEASTSSATKTKTIKQCEEEEEDASSVDSNNDEENDNEMSNVPLSDRQLPNKK